MNKCIQYTIDTNVPYGSPVVNAHMCNISHGVNVAQEVLEVEQ
jgi:hypothetical protein